jgi:hypothetical protein
MVTSMTTSSEDFFMVSWKAQVPGTGTENVDVKILLFLIGTGSGTVGGHIWIQDRDFFTVIGTRK